MVVLDYEGTVNKRITWFFTHCGGQQRPKISDYWFGKVITFLNHIFQHRNPVFPTRHTEGDTSKWNVCLNTIHFQRSLELFTNAQQIKYYTNSHPTANCICQRVFSIQWEEIKCPPFQIKESHENEISHQKPCGQPVRESGQPCKSKSHTCPIVSFQNKSLIKTQEIWTTVYLTPVPLCPFKIGVLLFKIKVSYKNPGLWEFNYLKLDIVSSAFQ